MIKQKTKKRITKVLLFVVLISTLLGTFTVFSSADSETDIPPGILGPSTPAFIYYPEGSNPDGRSSSLYPEVYLNEMSQIAFGLFNRSSSSKPWHIMPFDRYQDKFSDVVTDYKDLVYDLGYNSLANDVSLRSFILTTQFFQSYLSYSTVGDENYKFAVEFRLRNPSSWYYEWLPLYKILVFFIDDNGVTLDIPIDYGVLETSVDDGRSPVFSQGALMKDINTTVSFPYFDIGQIMSQGVGRGAKGVKFIVKEYFYNKNDIGYPTNNSEYLNNLYDAEIGQFPYTSYGFNFYWRSLSEIAKKEFEKGIQLGQKIGYDNGYDIGKSDGISLGENYNAVDAIFELAKVPGVFISSMLDFDFFGVNLANSVKVIFTVLIVGFIIVILLKFLL